MHPADERYHERERRIASQVKTLPALDLVPLAAAALKRMSSGQRDLARRFPLEDLARLEIWQREVNGY